MPIPTDYSTPVRLSAKERTLGQLQKWIIDGTLQPGEKLIDTELSEALGVSRTPIREAFQLLEVQGLIQTFPGKETRVTTLEKEDIIKLYAPLTVLQALAAELACELIQQENIEQLRSINASFSDSVNKEQLYEAMEYDEEFHETILHVANNQHILTFCSSLQMHIRRYKYIFFKRPNWESQAAADDHEAIINALAARDAAEASRLMKHNLIRPLAHLDSMLS
ncbi:DNA-binding GntR family transcriptional regulator [Paenibacillus endophyticus]|uniref:DNA-binding GntR family transcriptional regulator n=1 Tax=Paenibacillus endophyticus TaxID=1294268 RepID=A0A7W5C9A0_9BACL|nr:GntR family transcriptional regulator [Paenibacillus endophyticus]MBB3153105.1 DNA-binding GntR family transcriptional regulator [Paenibacillus endophyticus]